MKGTRKASEELSVLMAVRKHIIRLLVKRLLHTRTHVCLTVQCTGAVPTGGEGCDWSVGYLGNCDGALLCQFFFGLLTGVGVTEV